MTSHHEHSSARQWPVDPDATAEDIAGPSTAHPHRPSLGLAQLGLVVAGGFLGGLARYAVVDHWSTKPGQFPLPTFVVNTAGAFVLGALVIVVLDVLAGSRYLRPLVGAGFCGALTTFSSVTVAVDQLLRHGHVAVGLGYLLGSVVAGLGAAGLGATMGRALPPTRARRRMQGAGE